MNTTTALLTILVAFAATPAAAQPSTPGSAECAALQTLQLPGFALSEISAQWTPAGPAPSPFAPPPATIALPAYCRFQATLNRRTGADGQQSGIGFALAIPAAWNGGFLAEEPVPQAARSGSPA